MMLVLSVVLGIIPLLGVAWIVLHGSIGSVDGLFMSLILLTLSGISFLNLFLDFRERLKPQAAEGRLPSAGISTPGVQAPLQLPHHKVKIKKAGQRACNEKNEKGKFCGGHLKRWFYTVDVIEQDCGDVEKAWGLDTEGQISVFGLTVPPKET
jgi:hypothetical protein